MGLKFAECEDKAGIYQVHILPSLLFGFDSTDLFTQENKDIISVTKGRKTINYHLIIDDLKLFAKSEDQLESLIKTVRIFSDDIKMEFRLSKRAVLITEREKMLTKEGSIMPNGNTMKSLEEGTAFKHLGISEDEIKHKQVKDAP